MKIAAPAFCKDGFFYAVMPALCLHLHTRFEFRILT
jgi:hypothetical protein